MKSLTFYLVVIIIILAGLAYTFYDLNRKHKADAARWESNFEQTTRQVQNLNMTIDEFKKSVDQKTDSILEIAKIKPKNVTQITNYNTYYSDTTINVLTPVYEPKTGTYPFIDKAGCFEFSGFIKVNDTIPELNVLNRKFDSNFYEIEHYEKDTIHFLGLNFVKWWQKKRGTITIVDECTGNKFVKKINVK